MFILNGADKVSELWYLFKQTRNYCKSFFRAKMCEFFKEKDAKNMKAFWNLYRFMTKKALNSNISSVKLQTGEIVHDKTKITKGFNNHF